MKTQPPPPLTISFIWNYADSELVDPVIDIVRSSFARDRNKPFSRGLNIPLFFYSSQNPSEIPRDKPQGLAEKNIIFVFTSVNTNGWDSWQNYVEELPTSTNIAIVPVALDKEGLMHNGAALAGKNCIRAYEWLEDNRDLLAIVSLAHEIYRYGCLKLDPDSPGKASSITIFLSHAKAGDTGRLHAEQIKEFIDNTNMNRFFDANEISPGYSFEQEIENSIKNSTLVAIETDAYSARYWCQREILSAKQNNRPIIVVNSLDDYEDRIFPAASNVPCVHVSSAIPLSRRDILRVLSAAMLETIRFFHSLECLEFYQNIGLLDKRCALSARPPEIRQALKVKEKAGGKKLCYPEPPIYADEAEWHKHLDIEAFTPLWNIAEEDIFQKMRVGISISDVLEDGFSNNHLHPDHLVRLAQDLARHLLARSATLIYGGDLRPDGFTEFILDEAAILKERIKGTFPKVENHLAWPLYISGPDVVSWRSRFRHVMKTEQCEIPDDVSAKVSKDVFLPPNTPENVYVWSRCLTKMREESIDSSTVRVCAGGKLSGYKGKMPGVLEEIVLAVKSHKPTFLLGAFGGVVGAVCSVLLENDIPPALTEEWQVSHNSGYSDVQTIARGFGNECDYKAIISWLRSLNLSDMASRCGLTEEEYVQVMRSPFIDVCLHLILKGLKEVTDIGNRSA